MKKSIPSAIVSVCAAVILASSVSQSQVLPFPIDVPPSEEELALAPLLDLYNGGHAVGAAQGAGETQGALENGTLLPQTGYGYSASRSETNRWGTGMMISLLVNSAKVVADSFPGTVLKVGGLAQQFGGPYRPHKSHQNGLDADVQFVGTVKYESVLDESGAVTSKFDFDKNWAYWRLITSQQILVAGKPVSAVSMILVDPRIKAHICDVVNAHGGPQDELDVEVLKRLRPTEGHDDHFHVRLKCSPHYPNCIGSRDGFRDTGC